MDHVIYQHSKLIIINSKIIMINNKYNKKLSDMINIALYKIFVQKILFYKIGT